MRKSFIFVGLAFLVMLIFAAIYLPTLSRYRNLKIQQEQIEREIDILDEKIKALMEEKALLQNDVQYIEKIIRDQMGLVKPGEVVYKFITESMKPQKPMMTVNPQEEIPALLDAAAKSADETSAAPAAAPSPSVAPPAVPKSQAGEPSKKT